MLYRFYESGQTRAKKDLTRLSYPKDKSSIEAALKGAPNLHYAMGYLNEVDQQFNFLAPAEKKLLANYEYKIKEEEDSLVDIAGIEIGLLKSAVIPALFEGILRLFPQLHKGPGNNEFALGVNYKAPNEVGRSLMSTPEFDFLNAAKNKFGKNKALYAAELASLAVGTVLPPAVAIATNSDAVRENLPMASLALSAPAALNLLHTGYKTKNWKGMLPAIGKASVVMGLPYFTTTEILKEKAEVEDKLKGPQLKALLNHFYDM